MLVLRLIGPPRLEAANDAANDAAPWPLERRDAAWLAILALQGGTSRDTLAGWLWPDVPQKTADLDLRQRIFRLRRKTGQEPLQAADVVLLLPELQCDAALDPVAGADEAPLLASLAYDDCPVFADWLRLQRDARRQRWRETTAQAAHALANRGALAEALPLAEALARDEPLSEHTGRHLMRLHYLRGDRAAALGAFERLERDLKDELGARPDAETLALRSAVESSAVDIGAVARRIPVPASLMRPPRMVGRAAELRRLHAAWQSGRVLLLLGEAGMGKSRMLAEFATAHPGAVKAQARPGDAAVPFALLSRWLLALCERMQVPPDPSMRRELSRVLPDLGLAPAPAVEGQRLLLQRAVEWLVEQAQAQGLDCGIVDDTHFADDASLELMQTLMGSERLQAFRWALAQRPGEGAAAQALRGALEEGQSLQVESLLPLDEAGIAALVTSLALPGLDAAALAAPLLRHTGGNPLFLLETRKDLVLAGGTGPGALPQPTTVGVLIERRLRALSQTALALARVAALAGVDFSISLAETVLHKPALELVEAWLELQQAQVLAGERFAHDLVLDAVNRAVPETIARHVHAAIAEVLAAGGSEPARLAEHWRAAQRWANAADSFAQAAARARSAGRLGDALCLWQRGVDCHAQGTGCCKSPCMPSRSSACCAPVRWPTVSPATGPRRWKRLKPSSAWPRPKASPRWRLMRIGFVRCRYPNSAGPSRPCKCWKPRVIRWNGWAPHASAMNWRPRGPMP